MKRIFVIVLAFCLCFGMCGCSFWMDGSYHSVTPYVIEQTSAQQDSITINDQNQLQDALLQLVQQGSAAAVIYAPQLSADALSVYMKTTVDTLLRTDALCAYAVSDFQYEVGERNGKNAVALQVVYKHGAAEIGQVRQAQDMTGAQKLIDNALSACEAGVVLRVTAYEPMDFTQYVQDYVDDNPQTCMQMPQVSVALYPEKGDDRIVELTFTYQTSRDALRNMQETVQPVFSSAKNYVNTDASHLEQYSQLYVFLMGRDRYSIQTSSTPAYSLLSHGVGDSKAFAVVYSAMCRQSGLDCWVISGTKNGEPWCWNMIRVDGVLYHLDLLQCDQDGGFQLKQAEEMDSYVWDYTNYR